MTDASFRGMGLVRLLRWELLLSWAAISRGSRARLGQRLLLAGLGLVWLALMTLGIYWSLVLAVDRTPQAAWLYDLTLYSAWLGALAMVVFFNLGFLLHVVFFSRDLALLMAAPIDPRLVLAARFIEGMWSNALLNLFFSFPATVAVGMATGAGWSYYLAFLLAQAAFLAIPVAVTYLAGIPLARWVSTSKLRAFFSLAGFALAVFFWSLPQLAPSRLTSTQDWNAILLRGQGLLHLFESPGALLWPSTWAAGAQVKALHGDYAGSAARLAVLVGSAGLLVFLSVILAARSYLDGWIRLAPVAETRTARAERYTFLLALVPVSWRPVLWKDLAVVARDFRVSFQLYSLGLMMCLFPFMTLTTGDAGSGRGPAPLTALACAVGAGVIVGAQAGMMLVPLEGRSAWRLLGAPLPAGRVAAVKWLSATLLALPVVVAQGVLLRLAFARSAMDTLVGGVVTLAASLVGAAFGIWAGSSFANFGWDHPRRMITPGAQIVWGLGVGLITALMVFLSQVSLWGDPDWGYRFPGLGSGLLALLAGLLLGILAIRMAGRRLARLEWLDD